MNANSLLPPRNVWLPVAAGYPPFCALHEFSYFSAFGLPLLTSPFESLVASVLWAFPASVFVAAAVMFADGFSSPFRRRTQKISPARGCAVAAVGCGAPLAFASDALEPSVAALQAVCLPGLALSLLSLAAVLCAPAAALAPDGTARLRRAYLWAVLALVAAAAAVGSGRRDAAIDLASPQRARLVRSDGELLSIGILRITGGGVLYRAAGPDSEIRFAVWDDVRTLSWHR